MARCKNAPETSGRSRPPKPIEIKLFEDNEAKERYQVMKVCRVSDSIRPKDETHQRFACPRVLRTFDRPNIINSFCAWRKDSVYAAKINKFYGLQNTSDNHSKFVSGLKGKNPDFLLKDLYFPRAEWDSMNITVEKDRLKPEGKLWMHFIKQSLMPTTYTATASLGRLQLLHSILNGHSIDVGKIIVDESYACLTRKSSPLLFPHLITALCRKKEVFEGPEVCQRKGQLGITPENIPSSMGYDETTTTKQPTGGPRTIAPARMTALTTMVETTKAQLEETRNDICTFFQYVHERDQVIRANFMEMLPQIPVECPHFLQSLLRPAEAKGNKPHSAPPTPVKHTPNPP
ncbi:hypothetical protein V6N13_043034 [Hibiscus sabdariffa]